MTKLTTEYQKGYEDGKKATLEWQDISTAPKDWTEILLLEENQKIPTIGFELDDVWQELSTGLTINPTHWMPLPQAPEVDRE